jgi:FtsP/CotA-like multicopper oxidase with cupredoxin domain
LPDDSRVPERLTRDWQALAASGDASTTFLFQYRGGAWRINGESFDPTRPLVTVPAGAVRQWRFASDLHHPVHLHLAHFQVSDRNGQGPGRYDAGWKDTVDVRPAEMVAVVARFAGQPGRYVLHCHNLEHEDMAMMASFEVI